jgi:hypothetical protein
MAGDLMKVLKALPASRSIALVFPGSCGVADSELSSQGLGAPLRQGQNWSRLYVPRLVDPGVGQVGPLGAGPARIYRPPSYPWTDTRTQQSLELVMCSLPSHPTMLESDRNP